MPSALGRREDQEEFSLVKTSYHQTIPLSAYTVRTLWVLSDIAVPAQPLRDPLPACPCAGTPCQPPSSTAAGSVSSCPQPCSAQPLATLSHARWCFTSQPGSALALGICLVSGAGRGDEPLLPDLEADPLISYCSWALAPMELCLGVRMVGL